jgi:hypothetical protein
VACLSSCVWVSGCLCAARGISTPQKGDGTGGECIPLKDAVNGRFPDENFILRVRVLAMSHRHSRIVDLEVVLCVGACTAVNSMPGRIPSVCTIPDPTPMAPSFT